MAHIETCLDAAKEIVIALIQKDRLFVSQYPEAKSEADAAAAAYKTIFKAAYGAHQED